MFLDTMFSMFVLTGEDATALCYAKKWAFTRMELFNGVMHPLIYMNITYTYK